MKTRKDVTKSFLQLAATGRAQDAFEQHVGPGFRHHNPYFASGAKALMDGMNENARENPDKHLEVLRAIEEGDLVATYSFVRHKRDDPGAVVVHIFRFEGDRVAELWDVGQELPAEPVNADGVR